MANNVAPLDQIYVCDACGKTSRDKYGFGQEHSYGWDASCMMHAVLCYFPKSGDGWKEVQG